ncbi:unnamed protein product [Urochloa decumbens]|uniref:RRM domain-containing protein n=1 Tax=Urochloa decumbens TaxID=240449 RepID=A0ABC9G8M0_9POAL
MLPAPPHPPPPFLPWLLTPGGHDLPWMARLRSIFSSKTTWRAPGTSSRRRVKWLASADGVGAWLLIITGGVVRRSGDAGRSPSPSPPRLVNPLTGAAATLPPLPEEIERRIYIERATGVVAADGAVVLYDIGFYFESTSCILAAVLRPGDAAWTEAKTVLTPHTGLDHRCAAAYLHGDGEVILSDLYQSSTVKLRVAGGSGGDDDAGVVRELRTTPAEITPDQRAQRPRRVYTFESRGEVLEVVVAVPEAADVGGGPGDDLAAGDLSVWVYAMEEAAGDGRSSVRWVNRDARGLLGDRVLFLGSPTSFAVDAARFDGAGADIGGRLLAREEEQTIKIIRGSTSRFGPLVKMYVGNLPSWMCSVMLRDFFARYGTVRDARVVCDIASRQSLGFGLVTMESFDEPDSVIATYSEEMFYGDVLQVKSSHSSKRPFVILREIHRRGPQNGLVLQMRFHCS